MASIKGTAYFCKHLKPVPATKGPDGSEYKQRYEVQLGLDADGVKQAKSLGLRVNDSNDSIPMKYIKVTSNCETPELVASRKPTVYFGKTPGYEGYIWNGSKVNLIGDVKEFRGKPKFLWRAIQILELGKEPEGFVERVDVESELEDVDVTPPVVDKDLNDDLDDLP